MRKSPSGVSVKGTPGGTFNLDIEPAFVDGPDKNVWVVTNSEFEDSNVLLTLSDHSGVHTSLITGTKVEKVSPSDYIDAPKERIETKNHKRVATARKTGKIIGYAFVGVLLVFSSLSITGFIKARVVLTGSMVPAINPGDVIVTINPKYQAPKIGDVVTYQGRTFSGAPVALFSHRIISGNAADGFVVKGDHNPSPDVQHPKMPDILGVVIFTIPFIGKFLTKQALIFLVPIVAGLWIALDGMREAPVEN
jgi:signal peptidase